MGYVKVAVGFTGVKCDGCEFEGNFYHDNEDGNFCQLFDTTKPAGHRCEECFENELEEELCLLLICSVM